ncbi:MAG: hypothetical protein V1799_15835 [bacterium]
MVLNDAIIQQVWEKAAIDPTNDRAIWRKDRCGAWIKRSLYGDHLSSYGWVIEYIDVNGSEDPSNLQPIQWNNSVDATVGVLQCRITADELYNNTVIQKVWEKALIDPDNDSTVWRKDKCGAWIRRSLYGDRESLYGWVIEHIELNGTDHPSNLQPLQWKNALDASQGILQCRITADELLNSEIHQADPDKPGTKPGSTDHPSEG